MFFWNKRSILVIASILALAAGLKVFLLINQAVPFNSDEAVVALMARHILMGERPLLFYGQAYMGSLDAYLVAAIFLIIGQKIVAIRIVQVILYLLVIITTILIAYYAYSSWKPAAIAALLLAVPSINTTLYTTASLGGYGEALLIGNLIIITGSNIWNFGWKSNFEVGGKPEIIVLLMFLFGLLSGVGFWTNALTGVFSIPVGLILIWKLIRSKEFIWLKVGKIIPAIPGFLLGSIAWWIYAFQNGVAASFFELVGGAVKTQSIPYLQSVLGHLVNLLLLGMPVILGIRPPWEMKWLVLALLPFALLAWIFIISKWARKIIRTSSLSFLDRSLVGITGTLIIAFILTHFGNDPSGRYFLPLAVVLAIIAADVIIYHTRQRVIQFIIPTVIILYQFAGTIQCAANNPPGITTQFYAVSVVNHNYDQELIKFLRDEDEKYGYTNYWVSYPLAFLSGEQLIYTPSLPYHLDLNYTSRDDRYQPYGARVANSDKVAYIITKNPPLEDRVRLTFENSKVSWKEKKIGDFLVFYKLSKAIRPGEMGF